MKKRFIVANWKSNKTVEEAQDWLHAMVNFQQQQLNTEEKEVIICPPFLLIPLLKSFFDDHNLPFQLGAQDSSPFGSGAYTGEVYAAQLRQFALFTIIGHSERRQYFNEDDELLAKKVQKALEVELTPIFCIQGKDTPIPQGVTIVAYEPISAIGSGQPDTPEDAEAVAKVVREAHPEITAMLYGGSVTAENVHTFTQLPSVDGVLVGGASLDPQKFSAMIANA